MIMFDISEWIANLLVLGIAVVMWAIGVFMIAMIISMINQWVKEMVKGDSNENKQRIN
tara:strand:- start:643 stop:816 length:174 start_codon:yes stop_codon:yes gene_type:complete